MAGEGSGTYTTQAASFNQPFDERSRMAGAEEKPKIS